MSSHLSASRVFINFSSPFLPVDRYNAVNYFLSYSSFTSCIHEVQGHFFFFFFAETIPNFFAVAFLHSIFSRDHIYVLRNYVCLAIQPEQPEIITELLFLLLSGRNHSKIFRSSVSLFNLIT